MVSNKVLIFPKEKKNSSFDPMVELTHYLLRLSVGTRLLAQFNIAALEIFGIEMLLWSTAYRRYADYVFLLIDETMLKGGRSK